MYYFLEAFGVGCFLSIMIGPVFFLLLEISITKGIRAALLFDLGVLVSDVLYIFIALFFAFQVESLQESALLGFVGGAVFIGYGIFQLFYKKTKVERVNLSSDQDYIGLNTPEGKIEKKDVWMLIIKGFSLNFLNPGVVIYWFAIVAKSFDVVREYNNNFHVFVFMIIVLITFFGIDCLKAIGASKLKPLLTPERMKSMNRLIGVIFVATGIALILKQITILIYES